METRRNRRGADEHHFGGRHLHLSDLIKEAQHKPQLESNQYLLKKNIPAYPRPEIHVSRLKHDTNGKRLNGIRKDEGFSAYDDRSLLWWSLAVTPEDMASAETRPVSVTFPGGAEEQGQVQQGSLRKFATSPAFLNSSRLGSYRFTFPVEQVLKAYSEQVCSGEPPVMQVFETVLYKQEVMYVVLVSPANQEPPLQSHDPQAVCVYRDGCFIWRPEAMCETHSFELVQGSDEEMEAEMVRGFPQFYVWDNVAIALRVEDGQVLKFDAGDLRKNLSFCDRGVPAPPFIFSSFEEAEESVRRLWPDDPAPLKKEGSTAAAEPEADSRD